MLILYLALLIPALFWVTRVLWPEMAKSPLPNIAPQPASDDLSQERLATLLAEKNRNIQTLETELKVLHAQAFSFDKVRTLLENELLRLREQNRIFRSELGLPSVNQKENSIT